VNGHRTRGCRRCGISRGRVHRTLRCRSSWQGAKSRRVSSSRSSSVITRLDLDSSPSPPHACARPDRYGAYISRRVRHHSVAASRRSRRFSVNNVVAVAIAAPTSAATRVVHSIHSAYEENRLCGSLKSLLPKRAGPLDALAGPKPGRISVIPYSPNRSSGCRSRARTLPDGRGDRAAPWNCVPRPFPAG
jgi:hypothetical protein